MFCFLSYQNMYCQIWGYSIKRLISVYSVHVLYLRSATLNDAPVVLAFSFSDEMHRFCTEKHCFALEEELGRLTRGHCTLFESDAEGIHGFQPLSEAS